MPRAVRDTKLDSSSARRKLPVSGKPYYRSLEPGLHLGYRKGKKGGRWVVRWYDTEAKNKKGERKSDGYTVETIDGHPDDFEDANGETVLSFTQAQEIARRIARIRRRGQDEEHPDRTGPYKVKDAVDDYKLDFVRRGGRGLRSMEYAIDSHILPELGSREVAKLTRRQLRNWHNRLAESPARLRTAKGKDQQFREGDVEEDAEAKRKRRSTANRVLTVLKAALNYAFNEGMVSDNSAWAGVKPFRNVDAPKIRYLTEEESLRLINACDSDLRQIATAALLTGCRYAELARMTTGDFDAESNTLHVAPSKSGKTRTIYLTDEGANFFSNVTAGKKSEGLIFTKGDGAKWGHAHQTRPMVEACSAASINPAIGFHVLRHTYGSRLAMRGVPMAVIGEQLGHADTRMTEKHYAHLGPSYVSKTVRDAFGELGILEDSNVTPIRKREKSA